jgi:glutamate-ammonia-ligase adenylyltransferase
MHDLTQILRLTLEGHFNPATAPEGLKALLARAGQAGSFEELEITLKQALGDVLAAFDRMIV